jgi:hypothetical protein
MARAIRRAGWNVERDRELRHLAQADRHIAQVNKRIARQRAIVQAAMDKGQRFQEAESLLHAFEAGRRALEKHRQFILNTGKRWLAASQVNIKQQSNAGPNSRVILRQGARSAHDSGPRSVVA